MSEDAEAIGGVLQSLQARIRARRGADPQVSYSARLLAAPELAAKKFGEEAVETLIAALAQDPRRLVEESADLLYHWLVLLELRGVAMDDVAAALRARETRSGIEEKAARPKP